MCRTGNALARSTAEWNPAVERTGTRASVSDRKNGATLPPEAGRVATSLRYFASAFGAAGLLAAAAARASATLTARSAEFRMPSRVKMR